MASTRIVAQHAELRAATTRLWAALRDRLNGACAWVDTHPATDDLLAELPDPDRAVTGGEGTPLVDPASVPEFAALLGKPTGSGFRILAEAMELRHRLPRLWTRVQALEVAADDACRVAARTMSLDRPAADWVDQQLVHFAGTVSATQLDRTVEAARALAGEPQAAVESGLFVHLDHDTTSVNGRSRLHGELNLLDGLELDQALQHGAALQKFWGNPASLDVRRAHALAELARAQAMLPAPVAPKGTVAEELQPMGPEAGHEPVVESEGPPLRRPAPRPVTLHIVIPAGALPVDHDESGAGIGRIANTGSSITAEQVRLWCRVPGAKITVRPVIDLNDAEATDCYVPTARMREHVVLTNSTCIFPWCSTVAEQCDLDHIVAFDAGGPTSTDNLAPLCRRHHRAKTLHGWRYRHLAPRLFCWVSPAGHLYLRAGPMTHRLDRSSAGEDLGARPPGDPPAAPDTCAA